MSSLVTIHAIAYGDIITDYESSSEEVTLQSNIRIGSVTKMFIGALVMHIVNDGYFSLDHHVTTYLDYPSLDSITIRQLGFHTSGIPNYTEDSEFIEEVTSVNYNRIWSEEELIKIALSLPMKEQGEFHYSNTNYVLLGMICSKATGISVQDLLDKYIGSGLVIDTLASPRMRGYHYNDDNILEDVTDRNSSWASCAGHLVSTTETLIKLTRQVVSQSERSQFIDIPGHTSYGFGLVKFNDNWYGHEGSMPGYQVSVAYNPSSDITIVVASNRQYIIEDSVQLRPSSVVLAKLIAKYGIST